MFEAIDKAMLGVGCRCPLYKTCGDYTQGSNLCENNLDCLRHQETVDCYGAHRIDIKNNKKGFFEKILEQAFGMD